jgi:hypothetical protein
VAVITHNQNQGRTGIRPPTGVGANAGPTITALWRPGGCRAGTRTGRALGCATSDGGRPQPARPTYSVRELDFRAEGARGALCRTAAGARKG